MTVRRGNADIFRKEVNDLPEYEKIKIPTYSMKMRLYPNKEQKEAIDKMLRALHIAYNITFYEVFQKNEAVCTKPNADGDVWPDYRKMAKADWCHELIKRNKAVGDAPSDALKKKNGIFLCDAKRAWENGMHKRPVNPDDRAEFRFYNASKPRRSLSVQITPRGLIPSDDNGKVAWIKLPKIEEKIKARGFNRKVFFGKDGEHDYSEAQKANELGDLTVRVSKDNCGDYFISVTFTDGQNHDRGLFLEVPVPEKEKHPVGIDVGIKDIAITSDGEKINNSHFKKEKDKTLRKMNRQLSARWGPANEAFRDYNHEIRKENRKITDGEKTPLSDPSGRYVRIQTKKARLERKISRRRETYYHQQTAKLISQSSMIATETLLVKNMLRNHKLAYALSDAAMSSFTSMLQYKAERMKVDVLTIGTFEPSSQLCSVCGFRNTKVKSLSIRSWECPQCKTNLDRDVNAAKNILKIALEKGSAKDIELKPDEKPKKDRVRPPPGKRGEHPVSEDFPDIAVVFSKELTGKNDPRYIVINSKTKTVIDDAQGVGFRSISNAKNCFKAKKKWSGENNQQ